ncbi:MAG: DinB family protein [Planctomycetes bacterium]|nr:DinB family protein [Planctomycetota bacterium]
MSNERAQFIEKYKTGYKAVVDALAGATPAQLEHRPGPGKWSAKEVVHHLADSEMMSAMRLRLAVAADRPIIMGYDQDRFAQKFNYQSRPIESALQSFKCARESTLEIFPLLNEEDWKRESWHTESGLYTPAKWLSTYAKHAHDHADQIRRAIASAKTSEKK